MAICVFKYVFAYLLRRILRRQFMEKLYGAVSSHTRRPNHHIRQRKEKNSKEDPEAWPRVTSFFGREVRETLRHAPRAHSTSLIPFHIRRSVSHQLF
jgi:hypothetical protein